jgi:hypothetical protein
MLGQQKSDVWMRGANIETVGGGRVENMYQEMVYYNRMHVKTRLPQTILPKIVASSARRGADFYGVVHEGAVQPTLLCRRT